MIWYSLFLYSSCRLVTGRFLKDQELLKKDNRLFKKEQELF